MFWENLRFDVRLALRGLPRAPGFTAIVVLTLALGIAANTVIFSLMQPYLFRPLPYADAGRLVQLGHIDNVNGWDAARFSLDQIADIESRATTLGDVAGYYYSTRNFTGDAAPERVTTGILTANMFEVLGSGAKLGRTFGAADTEPVVVLGHGLWQRRFGADAGVLGTTVKLDGVAHTVIGVMPPEFNFPFGSVRAWIPIDPTADMRRREWSNLLPVARLDADATRAQAHAELNGIHADLATRHPDADGRFDGISVKPLREALNFAWQILTVSFGVLLAAVVAVLLLACVNVASLMLARASARAQDVAVRAAIGAGRGRIVQQYLVEAALLALMGGLLGVGLAPLVLRLLGPLIPEDLFRSGDFTVDGTVLLFTAAVTLMTPLAFGLGPALAMSHGNLNAALRAGGRGSSAGRAAMRGRRILVGAEVALAVVLIAAAGLMLRSFIAVQDVDLGFDPERLLAVEISLPEGDYAEREQVTTYFARAVEAVRPLPGVESAGTVTLLPLNHENAPVQYARPGNAPNDLDSWPVALYSRADPGYFAALGVPLRAGRDFDTTDVTGASIVVSAQLAARMWPDGDAVGGTLQFGDPRDPTTGTVVGVVGDVHHEEIAAAPRPHVYAAGVASAARRRFLVVRGADNPAALTRSTRAALARLDANLPIDIRPMAHVVRESTLQWGLTSVFLSAFGLVALSLAALGLYGIIAFSVTRRRKEMGIRMAMGATGTTIAGLVVSEGLMMVGRGLAVGLVLALIVARLAASLLFGIGPFDLATFVAVPALFALVAIVASAAPALRAARENPSDVLSYE